MFGIKSKKSKINYAFFGSSEFSVYILKELEKADILPSLIVTVPPKPKGRKMTVEPTLVKLWADDHKIKVIEPNTLKNPGEVYEIMRQPWDVFVVASYGKILPKNIIELPRKGTINVHPSLLPDLRGPAPIEYTILGDMKNTGVTIMKIDEEVDHGPIIASEKIEINPWPQDRMSLEETLGHFGGKLLVKTISNWVKGDIIETPQDHSKATFTKKVEKEDGLINLTDDPYKNLLKIKAYKGWPRTHFFYETKGGTKRLTITDAKMADDGSLKILKVIPEGKKEMPFEDYKRGL